MISKEEMKKHSQWAKACAREAARNKMLQDERQVMIQKAYDLKHRCDAVVDLAYGDLTLIITMLHDYVTILDESEAEQARERERKKKEQEEAERLAKKPSGRKGETSRDAHPMEQLSLFDMS